MFLLLFFLIGIDHTRRLMGSIDVWSEAMKTPPQRVVVDRKITRTHIAPAALYI